MESALLLAIAALLAILNILIAMIAMDVSAIAKEIIKVYPKR
jgi:hypothetical protein